MKKKIFFNILKIVFLLSWIIFVLGFSLKKKAEQKCIEYKIIVDNIHKFVINENIEKLLIRNNINLVGSIIDSLNFEKIEKLIETINGVKDAQLYSDFKGTIFINVKQRNPVMRIITDKNKQYYIDDEYYCLNTCTHYTANVIIINGNINDSLFNIIFKEKDEKLFIDNYGYSFKEIYELVNYINNHELWKYQFEQIYINDNKDLELVPRVGEHLIILGTPKDYKYKLGKLEAMYKKGFTLTDWNKYSKINLKFSNQVICKKR